MKIIILRHGKPEIPSLDRLTPIEFSGWVRSYNKAGLSMSSTPTSDALNIANQCKAVVCSSLPRSTQSATALKIANTTLNSSLFNEAGLPIANFNFPRLSPKAWAIIFRILWFFGYSKNSESYKAAKTRASKAAKTLIDLANNNTSVLFIGHGVYNQLVVNELISAGWTGPKSPGTRHWSYGVYTYPLNRP